MNSPTYRIKPLAWKFTPRYEGDDPFPDYDSWNESDTRGSYWVNRHVGDDSYERITWGYCYCDYYDEQSGASAESIEAAKAACEQHYRERMMEGLEEVIQDSGPAVNCIDGGYCSGCEHCIPAKARTK